MISHTTPDGRTIRLPDRFILNHIPGSKSEYDERCPKVYLTLAAQHGGTVYRFERYDMEGLRITSPRYRIYESKDYPAKVVYDLLLQECIRPVIVEELPAPKIDPCAVEKIRDALATVITQGNIYGG